MIKVDQEFGLDYNTTKEFFIEQDLSNVSWREILFTPLVLNQFGILSATFDYPMQFGRPDIFYDNVLF